MSRDDRGRSSTRRPPLPDREPLAWARREEGSTNLTESLVRSAVIFYGVLALAGIGLAALLADGPGTSLAILAERLVGPRPLVAVGLGVAVGLLLVAVTRLIESWGPIRALVDGFSAVLGKIEPGQALALAVASGIGEEIFFRGALQPWLGLWPTAVIFGVCHVPFERRFLAWPFFATGAGIVLGLAFEKSGSLLAPIIAHIVVNWINLATIARVAARTRTA